MSFMLILFGFILIVCRESDVFSSDWKTILLGIGAAFIAVAWELICDNNYRNETRIVKLEEEIKRHKEGSKKNEPEK